MKVVVTGGAGFIGSHFVRFLVSMGPEQISSISVIDKLTYSGNKENLADVRDSRLEFFEVDIRDYAAMLRIVEGNDVIINFAAESHVDRSITDSSVFWTTNVLGVHNLLEAARISKIPTFVQVSTDEVYGSIKHGQWTEASPLLPNSPYSASKASADLLCRSYFMTHGMDIRITRCSNNFGTHQFPEKVIPLFITNLIDGEKVPVYGDGSNIRDWLHVEDHCRGIFLVASAGQAGEIYNIGGGKEMSNLDLTQAILSAMDRGEEYIDFVPDRLGHDFRYCVDYGKIQRELGYTPQKSLHDELQSLIAWYRNNESWWRPLKSRK